MTEKVKSRRRIKVNKDTEVVVVNNTFGAFYYANPRMQAVIDLEHYGDEDTVTVSDLRAILNSSRKIIENFSLIITEVLDDEYTLDDIFAYLGIDKKYDEYFKLTPNNNRKNAQVHDISDFIIKSNQERFEQFLASMSKGLRAKVLETSLVLFRSKKMQDYGKMNIIKQYTNEDIFSDAEESEPNDNIEIG